MELFRLLGRIAIDNTEANNAIRDTTSEANGASSDVSNAFSKIGGVAAKIAKGIGLAGAAIGGAFIATIESTREYRKEMGLLEAAFDTAGHSSESAKSTYSELNSILGDSGQATEAAQQLALVADSEKELKTWTDICTGVYATFGEALPIEGLAEAANHTAKVGEVQGSLADALEWSGISVDDFNASLAECNTEQERQDLIMNTLNGTYKSAAEQYRETNKDVIEAEKAQERLADAFAEIGAIGEPIMTSVKNAIAGMAEKAVPLIEALVEKLTDTVKWIKENESTVQIWVGAILGATIAIGAFLLILNWSTIMTAAANAVKVVRTAILAMNAAMLANPIGLIVALIVGLVATFIYLWNNVDGFKKFWISAWNVIKDKAKQAKDWIVNAWANIGEWFTERFEKIQQAGKSAMDKVKNFFSDAKSKITSIFNNIGSWFGEKFNNAWQRIKNAFSSWGSFFSELWGKVKSKFGDIGTKIGEAMGNAVKKAMNGALSKIEGAINKGIRLINSAIKFAGKLGFDVSTVPEVSLPRLAKGAVITKPTVAEIGEDGAEAVVPLENNTEWINRIAVQLNERIGSADSVQELIREVKDINNLLREILKRNIYLDTGVLVGEIAPLMDAELGNIEARRARGNL